MAADNQSELLDIVDPMTNQIIGTSTRKEIHTAGHYHRAVHVLLFDLQSGGLLVQQRSEGKKIGALLWDLSVAEHVSGGGERYIDAAVRGMEEELGIKLQLKHREESNGEQNRDRNGNTVDNFIWYTQEETDIDLPRFVVVHDAKKQSLVYPEVNIIDNEFIVCYKMCVPNLASMVDKMRFDKNEVNDIRMMSMEQLEKGMRETPEVFTPWFRKVYDEHNDRVCGS